MEIWQMDDGTMYLLKDGTWYESVDGKVSVVAPEHGVSLEEYMRYVLMDARRVQ